MFTVNHRDAAFYLPLVVLELKMRICSVLSVKVCVCLDAALVGAPVSHAVVAVATIV